MSKLRIRNLLFRLIIIGLMVITLLLNIAILSIPFIGLRDGYNFYDVLEYLRNNQASSYFSLVIIIATYLTFIPFIITIILFLKKRDTSAILTIIYQFIIGVVLIVFQTIFQYFSSLTLVLLGIMLFIIVVNFSLNFFYEKKNNIEPEEFEDGEEKNKQLDKKSLSAISASFILDIIIVFSLISIFFVPFYVDNIDGQHIGVIANAFSSTGNNKLESLVFIFFFLFYVSNIIMLISLTTTFIANKKKFMVESKRYVLASVILAICFFACGYFTTFIKVNQQIECHTYAYVPMIIVGILFILASIFQGVYLNINEPIKLAKKQKKLSISPIIYAVLLTAVTIGSLFLKVIKVSFSGSFFESDVSLTGFDLLQKYPELGAGYQIVAFILIVMLFSSGIALLFTVTAFFSKYKYTNRLSKVCIYGNAFFMFILGMSGFYFTVAQEINKETIETLLAEYGLAFDISAIGYNLSTDAFFALLVDAIIIAAMLITKSLSKNEPLEDSNIVLQTPDMDAPLPVDVKDDGVGSGNVNDNGTIGEDEYTNFNPCPAFSEIDDQSLFFKEDYETRLQSHTSGKSLNDLVKFIVEYARNSRLHLSYTTEDVATFVSGLGACRLSILQGMSGTGKTSLPKIFSEAILGNCEIIEVESSWKDKNELLGYYNEFSKKYTPKKFTQSLYKASLNKDIPTFIVLDEMNLSRIEYYFSDFLSLMENEEDKREIKLLNVKLINRVNSENVHYLGLTNDHTIKVPSNIWFIGTANRDESTFVISDKVYDRAHTMNFNHRAKKVRDFTDPIPQEFYTYEDLASLLNEAKTNGTFDAENNGIIKAVEELLSPYNISFGNRILKQIEDFVNIYCACFPKKNVLNIAIERIILSKVVAKLEVKIVENKDKLIKEFEALNLDMCADFVASLNED